MRPLFHTDQAQGQLIYRFGAEETEMRAPQYLAPLRCCTSEHAAELASCMGVRELASKDARKSQSRRFGDCGAVSALGLHASGCGLRVSCEQVV